MNVELSHLWRHLRQSRKFFGFPWAINTEIKILSVLSWFINIKNLLPKLGLKVAGNTPLGTFGFTAIYKIKSAITCNFIFLKSKKEESEKSRTETNQLKHNEKNWKSDGKNVRKFCLRLFFFFWVVIFRNQRKIKARTQS